MASSASPPRTYVFRPHDVRVLPTVAKCYLPSSRSSPQSGSGVTLVCVHATTLHKETWEPFIEDLFRLAPPGTIRDVWAVDLPNHGQAARINKKVLQTEHVSWKRAARSIHALLNGLGTGVPVDFRTRRMVLVGHSLGAGLLSLAVSIKPCVPIEHLILVEVCAEQVRPRMTEIADKVTGQAERWASREDVRRALRGKGVWKRFDERVFEAYLKHGLQTDNGDSVVAACTVAQQQAIYVDFAGHDAVFAALPSLARQTQLHLVFATQHHPMMMPYESKKNMIEQAGAPLASVSWVEGPHLLVQTNPEAVARQVYDLLSDSMRETSTVSIPFGSQVQYATARL